MRRLAPLLAVLMVFALVAACGDETTTSQGEVNVVPANPTSDAAAIQAATNSLLQAFQAHDAGALRDLSGSRLREISQERQYDDLAGCVPQGAAIALVAADITGVGDTVTATMTISMSGTGRQPREVDWVWDLQRQDDGSWALNLLPDCPL